ncbi:MAG: ABC transporter substrate-binding protein [Hyphomicrobiaceae bacterium]|nr:ABC transporter substrate-binding protein [Hyphomicrobiaceae bacterium]
MKLAKTVWLGSALAAATIGLAAPAFAQDKEIVIGAQCDRTGPTQIVGTVLCPAYHDYMGLVNSRGGVEGYKIKVIEIDHEYKVPPAIEAHERFKKEGAVMTSAFGTPQLIALLKKFEEDKMPVTSPGIGSSAAADGKKYPYVFPIAATYWSQAGGAMKFVKDKLGGNLKGKKIAYIFFDNPAGRELIPLLEEIGKLEGFELRTFGVPSPGIEMAAQVLDITSRFKADFVVAHLFGRAPSVAIKEFKSKSYPLSKVIGLVWAGAEADIVAAGGFGIAEGYNTLQYAGVGSDFKVIKDIIAMHKAQGRTPGKEMESTVTYNRGVYQGAVHVAAIANAIKAKGGGKITGEDLRKGFESVTTLDPSLDGLAPPLKLSAEDHEGGGWVQVWSVKGGKFVKSSEWFQGYRDVVKKHVETENKK